MCLRAYAHVRVCTSACVLGGGCGGERGVAFCYGVSLLTSQTEGAVWQGSSLGSAALSPAPPGPHGISTRLMMIHHSFSKPSQRLPSALLHSCTLALF